MDSKQISRRLLFVLALFLAGRSFPSFAAEDWKQKWERTIDAAKREGEVVIYGPHNPMYRSLWDTFQKNHPGIKIDFVPGKGANTPRRSSLKDEPVNTSPISLWVVLPATAPIRPALWNLCELN